jgi:hypothetical protein
VSVDLTPIERAGYVHAHMKDDGGVYRLALADAEPLRAAWQAGRAFYDGTGPHGEAVSIKLAGVEGIVVWTPDANMRCEENSAAERERARARRLVEGEA